MDRWTTKFLQEHNNPIIGEFINDKSLIDVWRLLVSVELNIKAGHRNQYLK